MSNIAWSTLRTTLRSEIWPAGEAKTLRTAHNGYFALAMSDVQKWVGPVLQVLNTTIYDRCDMFWWDACTAITAPNGIVRRIYTIVNDNWRDKVFYQSSSFQKVLERSKRNYAAETPPVHVQYGQYYADVSVDSDVGRARDGIWSIDRRKLFLAPWLQVNEKLIVEWDGIKTEYADNDQINDEIWTRDVLELVKLFVLWKDEFYWGNRAKSAETKKMYDDALSDMMVVMRERTRQQQAVPLPESVTTLTSEEIENDADEAEDPGPDDVCSPAPTVLP